ncbi:MAG TPA: hypothetical protein VKM35_10235 [Arenimonas sp.]|nr:hypothetical protein [Arenimonas sp.]HMB57574.1 hypothetical protein [Arenimonas sp.]
MTTPDSLDPHAARRAGIRRTAWILAAVAFASYGLFLYSAMAPK